MRSAILAAIFLAFPAGFAAAQDDTENQEFKSWSKFKKGASVTLKVTSSFMGMTSETLLTTTLAEVGADKLVLETISVIKVNGMEIKSPADKRDVPKALKLPKDAKQPEPKGKAATEEGTESVKVAGVTVKAKWFKTKTEVDGSKVESKSWISDEVPGGLVKMETNIEGKTPTTSKMEVIEMKKP